MLVSNRVWPLGLSFDGQWCHLIMSSKVCIIVDLKIIIVRIQIVFLLRYTSHSFGRRPLATTCTWPMLCAYLRVSKSHYHGITCIISKLTGCIHPLLNICILAWELLDLSFYNILHEMLWLSRTLILHTLIHFILTRLKVELVLLITMGSNHSCVWQLWWRLESDTRLLSTVIKRSRIHFIVILSLWRRWVVLNPLCSSTIQQVIMHYRPSLPLCLHTSRRLMHLTTFNLCIRLKAHIRFWTLLAMITDAPKIMHDSLLILKFHLHLWVVSHIKLIEGAVPDGIQSRRPTRMYSCCSV